jgi:hypothetical protein
MVFLIARIGRHAGFARVVAKSGIYRMQYLEFSNKRERTTTSKNVSVNEIYKNDLNDSGIHLLFQMLTIVAYPPPVKWALCSAAWGGVQKCGLYGSVDSIMVSVIVRIISWWDKNRRKKRFLETRVRNTEQIRRGL